VLVGRQIIWILLENLWRVIKRFFTIAFVILIFLTGVVTVALAFYVSGLPQYRNPGDQAQIALAIVFGFFLIFISIGLGAWLYKKTQGEYGEEEF